ncbi:thermonuclease family protein [Poseidonibacter ostreae]|uniref:Thermonuclease family protein n=1 Tax=Poseidonibacter ostreae TaxID=2654171 RepID=A0ABQ6VPH1_9BACT|nr:thermonuclease family protein [Poseidonibacter ostreae]KAB7892560.1 thermonuclease family protein [Poseidonibacter ostreae]
MKRILLVILILINLLHAEKNYGSVSIDEVTSIYDGDTFRVNIKSYPEIIGHKMAIRLANVDTPEIRAKCTQEKVLARKAKQFTVNFIRKAKSLELRNMKKDKYFRIVADLFNEQNRSLSVELINNSLAVSYHGGKKAKDWCK